MSVSHTEGIKSLNRKFLITGATRGIGRALADRAFEEGDEVTFVWNRSKDASLDMLRDAERRGLTAKGHQCDLTDREATIRLAEKLAKEGPFDVVALCASIDVHPSLSADLPLGEWDRHINSTLIAPAILVSSLVDRINPGGVDNLPFVSQCSDLPRGYGSVRIFQSWTRSVLQGSL